MTTHRLTLAPRGGMGAGLIATTRRMLDRLDPITVSATVHADAIIAKLEA